MSAELARTSPRTPAGRRAALVILAAQEYPDLAPPDLDAEPCDGLGGPWEAATWSAPGGRRVVVVCFGPAATKIVRACEGYRSVESVPPAVRRPGTAGAGLVVPG